jgi:hypothetical protein
MPQLREYPQVTSLLSTDAFTLDRVGTGTVYIESDAFLDAALLNAIADLPAAATLVGTEPLPVIQNSVAVQTTPNAINDLIVGQSVSMTGSNWYNFSKIAIGTGSSTYPLYVYNAAGGAVSAFLVDNYATAAGAYGIESHIFPGSHGNVFHHYSDEDTCLKIDNVGTQSVITLNNTENGAVRPGVKGNGVFITFGGYDTSNVHGILAILGPTLQFASYDPAMQFNFTTGLICTAGVSETNRALAVTALNSGYAQTIAGTDSGLYIHTSANSGLTFAIDKAGTGAGTATYIVNRGTGSALEISDGTTTLLTVDKDGQVGVGTQPGAYGIAVLQGNTTQAFFGSSGANNANVYIDCAVAGKEANVLYSDASTIKWTVGKSTTNGYRVNLTGVGDIISINSSGDMVVSYTGGKLGFYGSAGTTKPTVTGSRGANAALASLLTALAAQGLLVDGSS